MEQVDENKDEQVMESKREMNESIRQQLRLKSIPSFYDVCSCWMCIWWIDDTQYLQERVFFYILRCADD